MIFGLDSNSLTRPRPASYRKKLMLPITRTKATPHILKVNVDWAEAEVEVKQKLEDEKDMGREREREMRSLCWYGIVSN